MFEWSLKYLQKETINDPDIFIATPVFFLSKGHGKFKTIYICDEGYFFLTAMYTYLLPRTEKAVVYLRLS